MLSWVHKLGVEILETGFWFMCPMPVKWDKDSGLLFCTGSKRHLLAFFLTVNMSGLLSLACLYTITTNMIIPRFNLDIAIIGLLTTGFIVLGTAWMFSVVSATNQGFILALNTFFQISNVAARSKFTKFKQ